MPNAQGTPHIGARDFGLLARRRGWSNWPENDILGPCGEYIDGPLEGLVSPSWKLEGLAFYGP